MKTLPKLSLVLLVILAFGGKLHAQVSVLATNQGHPGNILVDGSRTYWLDYQNSALRSVNKTQGGLVTTHSAAISANNWPGDLVQDTSFIYFLQGADVNLRVTKVSKTGSSPALLSTRGVGHGLAIHPANGRLYHWGSPRQFPGTIDIYFPIVSLSTLGGEDTPIFWPTDFDIEPNYFSTDSAYLHWSDFRQGAILRMPLAGGIVSVDAYASAPRAIAAPTTGPAGSYIFWVEGSGFLKRKKPGGEIITLLSGISDLPARLRCFAVVNSVVYCERVGAIVRVPIDGGAFVTVVNATDARGPRALASDGTYLFWTTAYGEVRRSPIAAPNTPPTIVVQPQNKTVTQGRPVTFSAGTSGTPPFTVQWFKSPSTTIANATNESYTISSVQLSNAGSYFATVRNSFGSVTSQSATLRVIACSAPAITTQPRSQTVTAGANLIFSVTASGTSPLSYQWRLGGTPLSGETSSILDWSPADLFDNGSRFDVVVRNSCGTVTSSAAVATVTCAFSVTPLSRSFTWVGGSGNTTITTDDLCSWSVTKKPSWITMTSATNGSGNATVSFLVATNSSTAARTAAMLIAGKSFVVNQAGNYPPDSLTAKTIVFKIQTGTGTLPATGSFAIVAATGTNKTAQLVPLTTPGLRSTNATYNFTKLSSSSASLSFTSFSTTLNFTNGTKGNFQISKSDKSQMNGTFTLVHNKPDYNADSRTDILWQNNSGVLYTWLMQGTNYVRTTSIRNGLAASTGWKASGSADFDRNGQSDLLFQTSTGTLGLWLMKQTNWLATVLLRSNTSAGTGWKVVTSADFTSDNQADILFQHDDGRLQLWKFSGTNYSSTVSLKAGQSAGAGWRAVATADFNGDRQNDILFQHEIGLIALWLMNGTVYLNSIAVPNAPVQDAAWKIAGAADFDLNGQNDILWQHTDGRVQIWLMNGTTYVRSFLLRSGQPVSNGLKCVSPK